MLTRHHGGSAREWLIALITGCVLFAVVERARFPVSSQKYRYEKAFSDVIHCSDNALTLSFQPSL
ncbi:MAG: hypothetical protein AAGH76_04140 [Pseudomonadota bacterium]